MLGCLAALPDRGQADAAAVAAQVAWRKDRRVRLGAWVFGMGGSWAFLGADGKGKWNADDKDLVDGHGVRRWEIGEIERRLGVNDRTADWGRSLDKLGMTFFVWCGERGDLLDWIRVVSSRFGP